MGFFNKSAVKEVADTKLESYRREVSKLLDEKNKLKEELEELKLKKRLEQEEIKHMVRIEKEKNEMELSKRKLQLEQEKATEITKLRDEQRVIVVKSLEDFHTKLEGRFNTELGNLKELYQALMSRLPNVTLALEKKL